jgi:Zn-dependent metalloprotease
MKFKSTLLIVVCIIAGSWNKLAAQNPKNPIEDSFVKETKAKINHNRSTGIISFALFPRAERLQIDGNNLKAKVSNFLLDYGFVFGLSDFEEELSIQKTTTDQIGHQHLYFDQKYQGIPVFGGDLRFHFDEQDKLSAVNGVYIPDIQTPTFPVFSKTTLFAFGLQIIEEQNLNASGLPLEVINDQLFIFRKGLVQGQQGSNHLVYELEISNHVDVLEYLYIDAIKGEIVEQFTGTHAVLTRKVYEDNTGNQVWEEGDVLPGSLDIWQRNEVEAAGHAYYLFANAFDYLSYDDSSAQMKTINNNPNISCPNANWNGNTTNFCSGTASDDVVGHEWAHAYTSYTSGLIYAWQSGALNESYSDIWGETIDIINGYEDSDEDLSDRVSCNSSDRWLIGEDATAFGGAIRDMWKPVCKGDPGKVTDTQYHCGSGDSGGVHSNSGVNNHAYALLVDGGSFNGQTISALGMTKAAHIFWRSQSVYLTNTSDFSAQADALEAATSDLIGTNLEGLSTASTPAGLSGEIITVTDSIEVSEVIEAVEFRIDPDCGFSPLLASDPPILCPDGKLQQNLMTQDFESGLGSWTVSQIPSNPSTWEPHDWEIITDLPDDRPGSGLYGADLIIGNCSSDLENGIIRLRSPWVEIPATATPPFVLAFDHYVSMEQDWDGGNIKYKLNDGSWILVPAFAFIFNAYNGSLNGGSNDNPMGGQEAFTGADEGSVAGSWGQSQINLEALGVVAGDNIRFRWELGTDGCNGWDGWYLDDILVCSCQAALPVTLVSFNARSNGQSVLLNWKTASELNNRGFEVQRKSSFTNNFEVITWQEGVGTSQEINHYEFEDKLVQTAVAYYYRLRQLDFNGKEQFSNIETVKLEGDKETNFFLRPNPAKEVVELVGDQPITGLISVELFDIQGRVVLPSNDIEESTTIDISSLVPGLYFVKIKSDIGTEIKRLVVE